MKRSAGILLYKYASGQPLVLLVHPGGPFWSGKDHGAWSIPKGEYESGEDPLAAAVREFAEETGARLSGPYDPLGEVVQSSGKRVEAWAMEGDFDPADLNSQDCEIEWPPKSGTIRAIPEVDRAAWFTFAEARRRILAGQIPFLDRLERQLAGY